MKVGIKKLQSVWASDGEHHTTSWFISLTHYQQQWQTDGRTDGQSVTEAYKV